MTVCDLNKLKRDPEGFLNRLDDWNTDVASALAAEEQITLDEERLVVVTMLRNFYLETEFAPPMRGLIKLVRERISPDKANSIYLLGLFPGRPVKLIAKIAGIPKPDHCL